MKYGFADRTIYFCITLTAPLQEIHRVLCPGGVMEAMEEGERINWMP